MHVEQRQVTNVDLHDGKVRDFVLFKDDHGYKLSVVARDKHEIVNLFLSWADLCKLREAVQTEIPVTVVKTNAKPVREKREWLAYAETGGYQWSTLDWLSYN